MKKTEMRLEEERKRFDRVAWGAGRVTFRAHLPTIQEQLTAGWPMSTVYERVKGSLAGLSYRGFTKLISKHFGPAPKQQSRKYEGICQCVISAGPARIVESPIQRESINDEKPKASGKPAKFRPGPRVPDPRQIY